MQLTKDKGVIILPSKNFQMDCHLDADFSGLWNMENYKDLTRVKSRTGYLILFMKFPLLSTSKIQTQIVLSTMEAEYISLSTAMRELIGVR